MRGSLVAAVAAGVALGCGGAEAVEPNAGRDATTDASLLDAGPPEVSPEVGDIVGDARDDVPPDVGPPVPCEAGDYFIVVNYDGGSQVLRHGCGIMPSVPSLFLNQTCTEDCQASFVCGGSDAGMLSLPFFGREICAVGVDGIGVYPIEGNTCSSSCRLGSETFFISGGQVRLKTFPPHGGTVSGDFVATFFPDGGGPISGTFCVLKAP